MKNRLNRRDFVKNAVKASAGIIAVPAIVPSTVWNSKKYTLPNDKINLGFIGVGGMGTGHVRSFIGHGDVNVVAVCDVRKEHRDRAKTIVDEKYGNTECAAYNDFRDLLSRKDIDGIVQAAPDHWHVLIGLEAAKQGKAMYYEKPMSYTVEEAQAIRDAVNRHNIIFQLGTQQRSDERFRFAVEVVRNQRIGELKRIVVGSASFTEVPVQPIEDVPPGLDYDLWLGPAPYAPFSPLRTTRQWTLIRDYSLGCLSGAWGIHHIDIAQWAVDADNSGPVEVEGTGTIPNEGLFDTFQHFEVEHTYANGVKLLHLDHGTARQKVKQFDVRSSMGILFEGSEGWIYVARGYIDAEPKSILKTVIGPNEIKLPVSNDHRRNFIDAMKTGNNPISPVGPGVKSEIVCQQADIAIRMGKKLRWDNDKEEFIGEPAANEFLSSPMRSPWRL